MNTTSTTAATSFYIRTNSGRRNFRLVTAPVSGPGKAGWKGTGASP